MKKIFAVTVFLFLAVQTGFAQLNDEEITNLRKQVKISDTDTIRVNQREGFSSVDTLKVFLTIERNGSVKKYFEKWIKEWNEKDGDQYGKLEQVNDISKADIVLSQFVSNKVKRVSEAGIRAGKYPTPGQPKVNANVGTGVGYASLKLPVYSYLIKRQNGIWTILYGGVETSIPNEQLFNPEFALWNAFDEKMKNR